MRQPVHLLIFAADPDRARAFYARVFGWTLPNRESRTGWVVTTSDDPRLGADGTDTRDTCVPTVHVADLDATIAAARAAGGDLLVPRLPVPGVGWLAYLADTENNLLGVMQDDPDAS